MFEKNMARPESNRRSGKKVFSGVGRADAGESGCGLVCHGKGGKKVNLVMRWHQKPKKKQTDPLPPVQGVFDGHDI
jgi:hypothetical protein